MSWIHIDDIVGIFRLAVENRRPSARSTGPRRIPSATPSSPRRSPPCSARRRHRGGSICPWARPTRCSADARRSGQGDHDRPESAPRQGRWHWATLPVSRPRRRPAGDLHEEAQAAEAAEHRAPPERRRVASLNAADAATAIISSDESQRRVPAPNVSAMVRMTAASAVRGRVSANRASGANHAGYFGLDLHDVAAEPPGPPARRPLSPPRLGTARAAAPVRAGAAAGDRARGRIRPLEGVGQLGRIREPLVRLVRHHLVDDADEGGGRSGRCSVIGTCRPLIRLPSRSIGDVPGNGSLPVIR